jgi:hypothetical protein
MEDEPMSYPVPKDDLDKRFTYHTPKNDQAARYVEMRSCARTLAECICVNVPEGRERTLALANLEQAVFWANAGIARGE